MKTGKVLLVGDVMLDVYVYSKIVGKALYDERAFEVEELKTSTSFGGNGLVAKNILELGGELILISVVGNDTDAKNYDGLRHPKLKKFLLKDRTRRTTVKKRWFAGDRALLQANQVDNHDISPALEEKIKRLVGKYIKNVDVLLVMDPQHGLLTKTLIKFLVQTAKIHKKPFYVDAQISHRPSNHHLYKGADCLFLNEKEAKAILPRFNRKSPEKSLRMIKDKLNLNNTVVKLGAEGSVAIFNDRFIQTKPHRVQAVDTTGAGDAFLAAMSLSDRNDPEKALRRANTWAALSTQIHGTIPPRKRDLDQALRSQDESR